MYETTSIEDRQFLKVDSKSSVFNRMKEYLHDYYIEPEKMLVSSDKTGAEERLAADDLDEYALRGRTLWKWKNKITLQTLERTILSLSMVNGFYFELHKIILNFPKF